MTLPTPAELAALIVLLASGIGLGIVTRRYALEGAAKTLVRWVQRAVMLIALLAGIEAVTGVGVWRAIDFVRARLNTELTVLAGTPLTPMTIITVLGVMLASWWISSLVRNGIIRITRARGIGDEGTTESLARLCQYVVMAVGVAIGLDTLGLDLSALFAASAVFAVGFGFAMQQIAENFVSGIILLAERTIRPGDILEVNGEVVRVQTLGIRATVARTLDDEEIILPNSLLSQGMVKNLRLTDTLLRIRVPVGVAYESDLAVTMATLERAAATLPTVPGRPPVTVLTAFGSSSVDFEVSIWTQEPWKAAAVRSATCFAIWNGLKDAGVVIAFPQLDVHFANEPVEVAG